MLVRNNSGNLLFKDGHAFDTEKGSIIYNKEYLEDRYKTRTEIASNKEIEKIIYQQYTDDYNEGDIEKVNQQANRKKREAYIGEIIALGWSMFAGVLTCITYIMEPGNFLVMGLLFSSGIAMTAEMGTRQNQFEAAEEERKQKVKQIKVENKHYEKVKAVMKDEDYLNELEREGIITAVINNNSLQMYELLSEGLKQEINNEIKMIGNIVGEVINQQLVMDKNNGVDSLNNPKLVLAKINKGKGV